MILPDTSVWIDHLRNTNLGLQAQLNDDNVYCHPFVIGELALGNFVHRRKVFASLRKLPLPILANNQDVLSMIEHHAMHGCGIGLIDAHLLASVMLTPETKLWTRDKRLRALASELGLDAGLV